MSIQEAQADLDEALQYRQSVIDELSNDEALLQFYLGSANWIVQQYEKRLELIKGQELE